MYHKVRSAILFSVIAAILVPSFIPINASGIGNIKSEVIAKAVTITDGAKLIGIDGLKDAGYTGSGVSVAIMDTGIYARHTDLEHGLGTTDCMITVNTSFVPSIDADDRDGHGSFIAGVLIGNGETSSGTNVGMAPGTTVWNVKVLDDVGDGEIPWIEEALDWLLALAVKPDIISISFGTAPPLPSIESRIKALWESGVIIVAAAGNEGPEYYSTNSPGSVLDVITVGACSYDEYLMAFSSEGPTMYDYYYKPDLVALGANITSLNIPNGYATGHGTSFSVPFIVGGISLLEQATDHSCSPDEIKAALLASCTPLGYDYFMEGAGLPNFTKALEILQDDGWNGVFVMPSIVTFPIYKREGTSSELKEKSIKLTVINSRVDGNVQVSIGPELSGKIIINIDDYEGGKDQFTINIEATPSVFFSGFSGNVTIKDSEGNPLFIITVIYEQASSYILPMIIILGVIIALVGVISFFIVAYKKGVKSLPENQCLMDGTCLIS